MGFRIIICVIFCLGFLFNVNAQGKYYIDGKKMNERHVPLKYLISETSNQIKDAHEWRKNNRREEKNSKQTKKHIYKNQTSMVKKRMKRSEKKSKNYNRGKVPLSVKLKRIISDG